MKVFRFLSLVLIAIFVSIQVLAQSTSDDNESFLNWERKTAVSKGEVWLEKGRVGGFFDGRILETNKSFNYKLRATLMSPEAIRAAARMEQIRSRLTNDETRKLVFEAEQEFLVIIVEIDPREGSGVIPNDWRAFIHSTDPTNNESIRGIIDSNLKNLKGLQSVIKRDYDYDVYWVSFSLIDKNGMPLWKSVPDNLELVVGIKEKEGTVTWKVGEELKLKIEKLLNIKSEKQK